LIYLFENDIPDHMVYIGLQSDHYVTLHRLVLPPPAASVISPRPIVRRRAKGM
jgi:hypothetical protein